MKYRPSFGVLLLANVALLLGIESAQMIARQLGIPKAHKSPPYLAENPYSKFIASYLLNFCGKILLASRSSEASPIPAKHQRLGTAQMQNNNK